MARQIDGISTLRALACQELGTSPWHEVTQDQVKLFAAATGDHQWIHVDVERAAQGPYRGTIAHGFLTLSLIPVLLASTIEITGRAMALNYGLDKVRFPTPVPVGGRVRAHVANTSVEDVRNGVRATYRITIELAGADKPACVAEFISHIPH